MRTLLKLLIKFYQRFISPLTPGSCRYYPTCSEYAIWQCENNSIFKAIYFTITRILKCNPLFIGGCDYPVIKYRSQRNIVFKKITVKYWYVPIDKDNFYVIKNWEYKKKNESKQ